MNEGKTDTEIFGDDEPTRILTKGRPKINEDLARRLFEAGKYTTGQIATRLDCHPESIRRLRRRLEKEGTIEVESDIRTRSFVEADFDQECINAKGTSFLAWLSSKRKEPRTPFNFCRRVWVHIWNKPSLVRVRDENDRLGDELCLKFLEQMTDKVENERNRDRKKKIRPLFAFLGRGDLNDDYLTMRQSRDPRPVKRIPEINSPKFPLLFEQCLDELELIDPEFAKAIRFKLVTQMRTGNRKQQRAFFGIKVGTDGKSYCYMESPDVFQIHVLEKQGQEWDIGWLPERVRDELYQLTKIKRKGDPLWSMNKRKLLEAWGDVTERIIGHRFTLHHLRKVSLTWLWICGLPLEVASRLNVGWKDLNTADQHYMHIGANLRFSVREEYIKNIPAWFKDGLDDYIRRDPDKMIALLNVK